MSSGASRLDPLLDSAPAGFLSFVDDGTIRFANATLLRMLGYPINDLTGKRVEAILGVGSRIFYQTHLFPLLRLHGHAEEIFMLLRGSDGSDVAVLLNAVRRERAGEWITDCVMMQVRERQKFEDALLRAKKDAEDARVAADERGRALQLAKETLEQQALELEFSQNQLLEQAEELEAQGEELRTLNEALEERSLDLEQQRTIADDANKAKSAFLAMMSHELRTPLNAIGGYVQLLEMGINGPVTAAQIESLGRIARSQKHLLRLVNDVLNLARIEAGHVDYDMDVFAMAEVVDAVLPMVEPQLAARELRHEVVVPRDLTALADRDKVQQILINLLSNASKFTPPGGCVRVEAFANPDGADRVSLSVRDDGIGIPSDRLEQVFQPFVQVDVNNARRAEGTGLGLSISRDLARGMGGDLTAHSEVGQGSTFTLTLRTR